MEPVRRFHTIALVDGTIEVRAKLVKHLTHLKRFLNAIYTLRESRIELQPSLPLASGPYLRDTTRAQFSWILDYYRFFRAGDQAPLSLELYREERESEYRAKRLRYATRAIEAPPWLIEESAQLYAICRTLTILGAKKLRVLCLTEAYARLDREIGDYPELEEAPEYEGGLLVDPRYRWLERRAESGDFLHFQDTTKYICPIGGGPAVTFFVKSDGTLWFCGSFLDRESRVFVPFPEETAVRSVSCGTAHVMVLRRDGRLMGYGWNGESQLGSPDWSVRSHLVAWEVVSVACLGEATMFIKRDATLWACGDNSFGQLGIGRLVVRQMQPVQVMTDVLSVACGLYHTQVIRRDGSLWATGRNMNGELCLAPGYERKTFVRVKKKKVNAVACGEEYTVLIRSAVGDLQGCGANTYGQMGDELLSQDAVIETAVASVACGAHHTVILDQYGTTLTLGSYSDQQLGQRDGEEGTMGANILSVACGPRTTFALDADGGLWCAGRNRSGELGLGLEAKSHPLAKVDFETGYHGPR